MIADNYQCEIADITSNNLHITDYKNLKAGMKLKIPFLSRPIMDTLEETESFISDYYPSLNTNFKDIKKDEKADEVIFEEEIKPTNEEKVIIKETEEILAIQDEVIPLNMKAKEAVVSLNKRVIINTPYYGNVVPSIPKEFLKKI